MNQESNPEIPSRTNPGNHFYKVIALHESPGLKWDEISLEVPLLPRGWFELSRFSVEDRIEFSRDYWLSKLSAYDALAADQIEQFFSELDDIGIFAAQTKQNHPFEVYMTYTLKGASGFFQGRPPAREESISTLVKQFSPMILPVDYLSFLQIHDGFSKYIDTGLIEIRQMVRTYRRLQEIVATESVTNSEGEPINPKSLIPFYESFALHCYQCFYADWYPKEEMGNVFFSAHDQHISNIHSTHNLEDQLAFSTFLDWLVFYLQDFWHVE